MKKIIALALAIVLAFALAIPAFAADGVVEGSAPSNGTLDGTSEEGAEVTYNVSGSYIVSVPVAISADTGAPGEISVSNIMLFYGTKLTIAVEYTGKLSTVDDVTEDDIAYELLYGENDDEVVTNVPFVTVEAGHNDNVTETIKADVTGQEKYAGVYSETITFVIKVA